MIANKNRKEKCEESLFVFFAIVALNEPDLPSWLPTIFSIIRASVLTLTRVQWCALAEYLFLAERDLFCLCPDFRRKLWIVLDEEHRKRFSWLQLEISIQPIHITVRVRECRFIYIYTHILSRMSTFCFCWNNNYNSTASKEQRNILFCTQYNNAYLDDAWSLISH